MQFKLEWNVKDGDMISPSVPSIKVDINDIIKQVQSINNLKIITEYPHEKKVIDIVDLMAIHRKIAVVKSLSTEYVEIETDNEIIINAMPKIPLKIAPIFAIFPNKARVVSLFLVYNIDGKISYF